MNFIKRFDHLRKQAEQRRAAALEAWRQPNHELLTSATHQAAFLAGYDSAAGQLPPTGAEISAKYVQQIADEAANKRQRLAALPPGTCPTCEGEGEFVGAMHLARCDECNGTGRSRIQEGGAE